MKKFLAGLLIGAGMAAFSILFSGCNHKSKNKAAIFYITQDSLWEDVKDTDVAPPTPADIYIANDITVICECDSFSPNHSIEHDDDKEECDDE